MSLPHARAAPPGRARAPRAPLTNRRPATAALLTLPLSDSDDDRDSLASSYDSDDYYDDDEESGEDEGADGDAGPFSAGAMDYAAFMRE